MTEFKNTAQQLHQFRIRIAVAGAFVFLCFALLVMRFLYLQLWHYNQYSLQADQNRISIVPIVPSRGIITDRNGVILAKNYIAYTLEIAPSKINGTLDKTIDRLSSIVSISARERRRFKQLLEDAARFESLPIRIRLSEQEVARFATQRFRFPGIEVHTRLFRQYPLGPTAAHVVGYIGHISQRDQARLRAISERNENDRDAGAGVDDPRLTLGNYKGTDYIGKIGIEQSYETELHGLTGFEEIEVTAGGHLVRTLSRKQATAGNNLTLSLDIGLQQAVEKAFAGKRGALIAIDPSTGEVLAFVSSPSFDPNLFIDGIDQQTWNALNNSPDKPLLNRPLHGTYPPGSTYKPFMALAGLTLHKRVPQWGFRDPGFYKVAKHVFHDDLRGGHGWVDMYRSIVISCDTYYYMLAHDLGVNTIADFMKPWGFGQLTGIDIEGEAKGVLPSTDWKKKAYRQPDRQRWYDGETVNLGVGQGYNSFTMLQLAHAVATLANNGVVVKPHLVKQIANPLTHKVRLTEPSPNIKIALDQKNINFVKRAMVGVAKEGTAAAAFRGARYQAAAKTGTVQVYSLRGGRYRAQMVEENRRDHALFVAFAPVDLSATDNHSRLSTNSTDLTDQSAATPSPAPKIAFAMIVENGGWGAQAAAPIARKVLDYYLIDRFEETAQPPL